MKTNQIIGGFIIGLGYIAAFAGAFAFSVFTWGFVMLKFWNWFILPVFTTLPVINYYQAIGLFCFLALFKSNIPVNKNETSSSSWMIFLTPIITFIVGWIIHAWII